MSGFPELGAWRDACAGDAVLAAWAGAWSLCFAVQSGDAVSVFALDEGRVQRDTGTPAFTLRAPPTVWAKFLRTNPAAASSRHFRHDVSRAGVCHRRRHAVLHAVRPCCSACPGGGEVAGTRPCRAGAGVAATAWRRAAGAGGQRGLRAGDGAGLHLSVYCETAGEGRDLLCLHTAGADGRQFHGLMADPRITAGHRLVAFDLPWHGKSPPPDGAIPGSWRLNTELYVDLIMEFIAAAKLHRPIVLGASMSGEICLELALRHPEAFTAIVACEASDKIERRQTHWAAHPQVNQAYFVPEWIRALCAPQSPAEYAEAIAWHYAQGGPGVFFGDIAFYSGDWDARERVHRIDTNRIPLFMLTGEYDYSCTVEHSQTTAAKIPGVRFQAMPGIGHFPFAENPALFAEYLLPILRLVAG